MRLAVCLGFALVVTCAAAAQQGPVGVTNPPGKVMVPPDGASGDSEKDAKAREAAKEQLTKRLKELKEQQTSLTRQLIAVQVQISALPTQKQPTLGASPVTTALQRKTLEDQRVKLQTQLTAVEKEISRTQAALNSLQ